MVTLISQPSPGPSTAAVSTPIKTLVPGAPPQIIKFSSPTAPTVTPARPGASLVRIRAPGKHQINDFALDAIIEVAPSGDEKYKRQSRQLFYYYLSENLNEKFEREMKKFSLNQK